MKKKIVIIIKEKLEYAADFFSLLKEKNIFALKKISYQEIFSDACRELLKTNNLVNVIILIHPVFYKSVDTELDKYLKQVYNTAFKNLLYFYSNDDFMQELTVSSGTRHAFFYSGKGGDREQVNNLILYLLKAYNESINSFRLHDYIADSFKGVVVTELLKRKNEEIERLNQELELKNKIDSLTQLYNRATIFDFLEQERTRTLRDLWRKEKALQGQCNGNGPQPASDADCEPLGSILNHYGVLSLMLIDIDQFKKINDTYGHLQGDEVLRYFGLLLHDTEIFRENDLSGRWGGEEFLVILPDTNVQNALEPAERFIKKLARQTFGSGDETFRVTVSIGISQSTGQDDSKEDIIRRADTALYYAKGHGRNQYIVYEELKK